MPPFSWDSGFSGPTQPDFGSNRPVVRTDLGTDFEGTRFPFGSDQHVINPYSKPLWNGDSFELAGPSWHAERPDRRQAGCCQQLTPT